MKSAIQSTVLAAALAALAPGASATPIKVDFESLWTDPVARDAAPIAVGAVDRVVFEPNTAWAYKAGMLTDDDILPKAWDTG